MGTTSEELKKLYAKLGGKDPKVAGFSAPGEILNAINEIPLPTEYELPTVTTEDAGDVLVVNEEGKWDKGEASGGLPEVTTDDNGDILQVVEGAWAKAAMSKDVVVYYVERDSAGIKLRDNKTLQNIMDDYHANKLVVLRHHSDKRSWIVYHCTEPNTIVTMCAVGFRFANGNNTTYLQSYIAKNASVGTNVLYENIDACLNVQILPFSTSSDAGKIAMVNSNGYWTKAEPSGGAVEVFSITTTEGPNQLVTINDGKTIQDILDCIDGGKIPVLADQNKTYFYYMNKKSGVFSPNTPYFESTGFAYQQGSTGGYYLSATIISGQINSGVITELRLSQYKFQMTEMN